MGIFKHCLFFLFLLVVSSTSQALHWNLGYKLCPEEIIRIPPLIERLPVPVGCEVVDCCPGCPGPEPLDWRIRVDETRFSGVRIQVEGMSAEQLRKLKIKGKAEISEKGIIQVGAGETVISGFPNQMKGLTPVAFITPIANQKQAAMDSVNSDETDAGFQIDQLLGPYVVNNFRSRFVLVPCLGGGGSGDTLELTNNTSNDSAIAVLDHRTSGCNNDVIERLTTSEGLGNILSNGSCRSSVSVFSDDNAMSYEPDVTTWTDSTGDVHTVDLDGMIVVPVSVWLADDDFTARAQNDFANANFLYNQNNVGIQFEPSYEVYEDDEGADGTIGTWCPTAATVGNLQSSDWYTANQLNVYYVDSAFTGVNCGADRNLNFLGTTANLGSLPHEIGHAYGLRPSGSWGHTNGVAGFGNQNIMWGGGPGTRDHFSVGQSFRINTDSTSMLNSNGDRSGPTETCLPNASSNICPDLDLDSLPH